MGKGSWKRIKYNNGAPHERNNAKKEKTGKEKTQEGSTDLQEKGMEKGNTQEEKETSEVFVGRNATGRARMID